MAAHAPQAAAYAVQAVQASGSGRDDVMAADREREWQHGRLPQVIRGLVLSVGQREARSSSSTTCDERGGAHGDALTCQISFPGGRAALGW